MRRTRVWMRDGRWHGSSDVAAMMSNVRLDEISSVSIFRERMRSLGSLIVMAIYVTVPRPDEIIIKKFACRWLVLETAMSIKKH
jgi:hypothetical protein